MEKRSYRNLKGMLKIRKLCEPNIPRKAYTTKIDFGGEEAYGEVSSFLEDISFGKKDCNKNTFYFFDECKEGVAKLNSKKNTIELTDKVEGWIVESINHINEQNGVK
jgi:hypothetical protein